MLTSRPPARIVVRGMLQSQRRRQQAERRGCEREPGSLRGPWPRLTDQHVMPSTRVRREGNTAALPGGSVAARHAGRRRLHRWEVAVSSRWGAAEAAAGGYTLPL